jgi:cell division protein FtsW
MKKDHILAMNEARNRDIRRIGANSRTMLPARRMHAGLLIITLIMICFGLVMLFSASMSDGYASQSGNSMYYVIKQASITAAGLILALILALILPVSFFDRLWMGLILYGLTSGLLVYVKFFGIVRNGARRWVDIGISFQPSEMAKLALVFCFAAWCSFLRRRRKAGKFRFRTPLRQFLADGWLDILLPGLAILLWIGLVLWQPHLSGAIILTFIAGVVFLTAGIAWRSWVSGLLQLLVIVLVLALLVSLALPLLPETDFKASIQDNFKHVNKRIETFLEPDAAEDDDKYQIEQSLIAIGSGGLTGIGLGEGRQKYNYLPEAHNDYVFAIIGEELGFIGTMAVLLLFVLFMLMGTGITRKASNTYAAVLAGGYTMLISVQAFLNIAVATRTIPATGISLPFFSYGGTSNMFFLLAIGLILAVSRTGQTLVRTAEPGDQTAVPSRAGGQND